MSSKDTPFLLLMWRKDGKRGDRRVSGVRSGQMMQEATKVLTDPDLFGAEVANACRELGRDLMTTRLILGAPKNRIQLIQRNPVAGGFVIGDPRKGDRAVLEAIDRLLAAANRAISRGKGNFPPGSATFRSVEQLVH